MKFADIVARLSSLSKDNSLTGHADHNPEITGIAPIDEARGETLSYIEGAKFASMVHETGAGALILPMDTTLQGAANDRGIAWISTPDPRLLFAHAIKLFYQPYRPKAGIHPTAVIDPGATVGEDVHIGAHSVIESGVTIGDKACIHPNVVIYPGSTIGPNTILHANCTIHERSRIGADCVIHSGAVIGAEGFGFVPVREGWFKMEQSGYVVLEDGVEIGCNSTVDRPATGETRIGRNTKLDNMVHVAHSCQIGENCALAGQVGLAGGVKLGNRVILAGQVGVANGSEIGDGAIASAQTGIHNNINPGEIVSGSPAMPNKQFLRVSALYKRLPEIHQLLKQLQKQIQQH
ncbi:MAG: UDP-3-O-acylglucosamine N-acyltransferase [Chroococcopsis gigantea SAG 12.99]|jgi:UDP-3-O-[3-hydroxymyristoyl] glucosamine N-acyltransferase|nr:UDP-3-O-(3-hydroxymyristoyl)glucosamine N-acyltransferase [Chlorogloea purpurea SAG 13.99]MDV2998947.1 UDP-3-O-acylglucosamine N-acyltransferase [Chroococcopsis gigantea SAG 12.99]